MNSLYFFKDKFPDFPFRFSADAFPVLCGGIERKVHKSHDDVHALQDHVFFTVYLFNIFGDKADGISPLCNVQIFNQKSFEFEAGVFCFGQFVKDEAQGNIFLYIVNAERMADKEIIKFAVRLVFGFRENVEVLVGTNPALRGAMAPRGAGFVISLFSRSCRSCRSACR